MTYWSGVVDETDLCHLGGTPHGLLDVLGLRMEEIDGLYDFEENEGIPAEGNELGLEKTYKAEHLCELVELRGAHVLMTYGKDFYAGKPVLTSHVFGKGTAYYVCADMEEAFYEDCFKRILEKHEVSSLLPGIKLPKGVEVSSRETDTKRFLFIQNFGEEDVTITYPQTYRVLLGAENGRIGKLETAVLEWSAE